MILHIDLQTRTIQAHFCSRVDMIKNVYSFRISHVSSYFIAALNRFIVRKEKSQILSDYGITFVSFCNEIKDLSEFSKSSESCMADSCAHIWSLVPGHSLHFDGLWEAVVKLINGHLKRLLSKRNPSYPYGDYDIFILVSIWLFTAYFCSIRRCKKQYGFHTSTISLDHTLRELFKVSGSAATSPTFLSDPE